MKLLALDTSSDACSVAVAVDDAIVERHAVEPKQHTRLLLPMIDEVLRDAGVVLDDLDAIVLGNGPGSFIGLRIAASVAQGLAFGAGLKIVPVSSLAAIAAQAIVEDNASLVAVAQDARMSEVYLGLYVEGAGGAPELNDTESIQSASEVVLPASGDEDDHGWLAAGAGWQRYPQLFAANQHRICGVSQINLPRARFLLGPAAVCDAIEPHKLEPAYLRKEVATAPR
jgi:tRNA threonylcarbamoyladenosine biosynthesis protein TsaB